MNDEWLEKCEQAVKDWENNPYKDKGIVCHPTNWEDAVAIKEYMVKVHPEIKLFIYIDGFVNWD